MEKTTANKKDYIIRSFNHGEEKYVAELHKTLYADEYLWGSAFINYAVEVALEFARREKNCREEMFIAGCDGKPVGCIMLCQSDDPAVGQLRLFAVEKEYRCYGIGSALIKALMKKAKEARYEKLILWTASPLTSAIRHYEKLGFKATESIENTTWRTDGSSLQEIKMEMSIS